MEVLFPRDWFRLCGAGGEGSRFMSASSILERELTVYELDEVFEALDFNLDDALTKRGISACGPGYQDIDLGGAAQVGVTPIPTRRRSAPSAFCESVEKAKLERHNCEFAMCPGDVLSIRPDPNYSAMTRLGSAGGFLGHVLLVMSPPRPITKQCPEGRFYHAFWPHGRKCIWQVQVMECCRNSPGLHETGMLFYIDEQGRFVPFGEDDTDQVYKYDEHIQMHVWRAPEEVRGNYFHNDIMIEVLDVMRANSHSVNWSWSTALRAYFRPGKLSEEAQPSMVDLEAAWRAEPICTSIVVIFWQLYLQKLSLRYGADPLPAIMQYMPMRADRVLTGELLATLLSHGWSVRETALASQAPNCALQQSCERLRKAFGEKQLPLGGVLPLGRVQV